MRREDDYPQRRAHLANLTDEALYLKFWELADRLVEPMLDAGKRYTTPAIERSVLLRMGFSSVEAKLIVQGAIEHQLMGKGCGHVVWRLAQALELSLREAGERLSRGDGWDEAVSLLRGGKT